MKKLLLSIAAVAAAACGSYSAAAETTIGDKYQMVTSADDLVIDGEYILCYETNAMGARTGKNKYHSAVADGVKIDNNVATIAKTDVQSFTLVAGTETDTYAFKFADSNYFSTTAIGNGSSATSTTLVKNCNLSISIASTGVATIIPTNNSNDNKCKIQYNGTSGQERFTNYKTGTQNDCTLYKKVDNGGGEDPVDPVEPGFKWMLGDTEAEVAEVTVGAADNVFPTLYNPNNVTVTYSIDADGEDPAPATIDPTTGAITLLNEGIVMVGAKSEASAKYLSGRAYYMLLINPAAPETKCATPTFSHPSGVVAKGTEVTISCTTEGAKLLYFLDEEPYEAEGNTVTVTINQDTDISVWAEKEGLEDSEIAEASYLVDEQGGTDPVEEHTVYFYSKSNSSDPDAIVFANNSDDNLIGETFTSNGITVEFDDNGQNNKSKVSSNLVRWYKWNKINITPGKNIGITEISIVAPTNGKSDYAPSYSVTVSGETTSTDVTSSDNVGTWTTDKVITVPVTLYADQNQVRFEKLSVKYKSTTTGIDNVTANDENAPVEYFNLQGIRVENPANGVYIRRQGSTVTKVLVK